MELQDKEELFADLFAYRIYLQDIYENEIDIIKKLKIKLYYLNIPLSSTNSILLEFYQFYNIPIYETDIENARVFLIFNTETNLNNSNINTETNLNNYINANNNINNINNILVNRILSRLISHNGIYNITELLTNNNPRQETDSENETINENEFNSNFQVFKYKKNELETETNVCSICIDEFQEEQEIIKLSCNHIFHYNCIKSYLLNYNNKCPLCRNSCI